MTLNTASDQAEPPAARYRMVVVSGHSHADTAALADQRLRGWLKREGYDEPPSLLAGLPPADLPRPGAGRPGGPPEAVRHRLADRASLDLDAGLLRLAAPGPGGDLGGHPVPAPA
uniref:hypothetical protein n=1 Tax=Peterkaempfera griseoplana TaxID=66896 RepID=UPI000A4DCBB6